MADIKWIKITTDIFDDEKILLIESLPAADSIIVIWFKLLALAGKQNNHGVFMLSDKIFYTDEMLATIFRRELLTVKLALKTFEEFGMIEVVDNVITIPNWEKHQNTEGMDKVREQTRRRVAAHRQRQKLIADGNDICNATVTQGNAIDKDKEEDKEKDKNIYIAVVSYLNEKAGTGYKPTSKKTQSLIKARLNDGFDIEDFKRVIDNKCAEWLGKDMEQYLRPETLFGTKSESYLNAKIRKSNQRQRSNEPDDLDGIL
jgi:predicted phage replisome organizer/uncharacterized phage protein (TIGR02220 family)